MKKTAARRIRRVAGGRAIPSISIAGLLWFRGFLGTARAQQLMLPKLRPPHEEIAPTFWEQYHWVIIIAAVLILMMAALAVVWFRRPRPVIVLPPGILAWKALESLRNRAEGGVLVMEVSRVVKNYVVSVFLLPPEELTTAELLRALEGRPQIEPDLVAAIGGFLRRCDEQKFAPATLPPQMGVVQRALDLVAAIEKRRQQQSAPAQPPPVAAPSTGNS